jgi:hypothetical protein
MKWNGIMDSWNGIMECNAMESWNGIMECNAMESWNHGIWNMELDLHNLHGLDK